MMRGLLRAVVCSRMRAVVSSMGAVVGLMMRSVAGSMMRSIAGSMRAVVVGSMGAVVELMVRAGVGLIGAVVGLMVAIVGLMLQCIAFVVGMGSGARPRWSPILILLCRCYKLKLAGMKKINRIGKRYQLEIMSSSSVYV